MRAIWKGTISFGLVSIPISLFPATRREEIRFRLLRESDLSPVNYKRVAEVDGKEVPWEKIVKGYEYEKGKFVVLKDGDFARVDVEATQTVDIMNFVELREINPLLFSKPYYMQAEKGGDKAYVLLRDTLARSGKVGIAKVVIKERQHLAAIKSQQNGLMLELMRFPDEVLEATDFPTPKGQGASKAELTMADKLVESMTTRWKPADYHDDFREALEKLIEKKIESGGKELPAPKQARKATSAVDLVAMLQQSIRQTKDGVRDGKLKTNGKKTPARGAMKAHRASRHHLN